jgi:hypothetical protein
MARRANATSFKPGKTGNPKGRPPGIKELRPRGYVKAAIDAVMAADATLLKNAILSGLKDRREARGWAELIAKIGKEVGTDAAHDTKPVVFNFFTNLNPMALAGPQASTRRIIDGEPSRGVGAPGLPVQAGGRRRPLTPERPQDVTSEGR